MNEFTVDPISGRQILHVSATGEFTWHPDAGTLIETCDFSDSPSMQHILRKLWDHEHPVKSNDARFNEGFAMGFAAAKPTPMQKRADYLPPQGNSL